MNNSKSINDSIYIGDLSGKNITEKVVLINIKEDTGGTITNVTDTIGSNVIIIQSYFSS